jgi:predicted ribosome quality control (RQC) complex YloA/Tae2 family protein
VLSLAELRAAAAALDELLGGGSDGERGGPARLRGIAQTDAHTVHLRFHVPGGPEGGGGRHEIVLSCDPRHARVGRVASRPEAPAEPPAFAQFLRAHLDRARFAGARIVGDDRQLALRLDAREGAFDLLLQLLGPRSNLYLLEADGPLRATLRPLAETRRDLAVGDPWRSPESAAPDEGEDRFAGAEGGAYLDAVEAHYGPLERAAESEGLARRLSQVVAKERKRLERRMGKLEQDALAGDEAAALHRQGELLKSVLGSVAAGASEVVARDFTTGEPVTIPLDPKLSPNANLERIFKRYHKALKRATVAGGSLADAEQRREMLAALAEEIDAKADDADALAAIAERDEVGRLVARHAPPPPAPAASQKKSERGRRSGVPRRLQPKRYRASGDLEIWVGKSDEANDYLTTRLARGKDLFLHLEAQPGSHVILRTGGRDDPPQEALLEACELAVHFSKQRKANRANVHVVPIKNVKKPKGAKPGLVYVTGGKTVHLRRDEARLSRILDAVIDGDVG